MTSQTSLPESTEVRATSTDKPLVVTVSSGFSGKRLDHLLAEYYPQHSRVTLQRWIKNGHVTVDGETVTRAANKLNAQMRVAITPVITPPTSIIAPQAIELAVVHSDAALYVINKPAGLIMHPGAGRPDGTIQNALLHLNPEQARLPRAGIIHRLDKDTTGLFLVAKRLESYYTLVDALQRRVIKREYYALVHGRLTESLIIDAPIGRHRKKRTHMAVVVDGKPARTHVEPLHYHTTSTWVRCTLETGRTHQIRVHLAYSGFPMVGDAVYGLRRAKLLFHRPALHAYRLSLSHPDSAHACVWKAPLPADLRQLQAQQAAVVLPNSPPT